MNFRNNEKQRIASLQIMTAFTGNEEIHLYEEQQIGVLEYRDLRQYDKEHEQNKIIDLEPETFAKLKSKMDFKTPQALEPHCMLVMETMKHYPRRALHERVD